MSRNAIVALARRFSSGQRLVDVEYSTEPGKTRDYRVATIKMNNPPANILSSSFLSSLNATLKDVAGKRGEVDGVIISSSLGNVFSAGLDLTELADTNKNKLMEYWTLFQDCWYNIYSYCLPIVAAINGHSLAGGTVIAVASDYRIAAHGNYNVGITAAKIGVVAPPWVQANIKDIIGWRQTDMMLSQAKLFSPEEALKINLLDEICNGDLLLNASLSLLPFMETLEEPRLRMKYSLRRELLANFESWREKDRDEFVDFVLTPSVQKNIDNFISNFKK